MERDSPPLFGFTGSFITSATVLSFQVISCSAIKRAAQKWFFFFFFLGCCCHRGAKADSQGLSELTHSYYHQLNLSLHSEFIVFQTGESFFYSTLVLVCLHSPCLVILVWITWRICEYQFSYWQTAGFQKPKSFSLYKTLCYGSYEPQQSYLGDIPSNHSTMIYQPN